MGSKQRPGKSVLPFIIIGGVLVIAIGGGALLFRSAKQPASTPPKTPPSSSPSSSSSLAGAKPAHVKGSEKAPVVLEEFGEDRRREVEAAAGRGEIELECARVVPRRAQVRGGERREEVAEFAESGDQQ